ncbi:MAG: cyclic 2,3-diphosphoglycerate synthase [Candidatus Promineifilaceae bacterium]
MQNVRRIVIVGAAGRDFHDFNTIFRDDASHKVIAFTATQIPNIEGRLYPTELAGDLYPHGIPIYPEADLERLIHDENLDEVVFSYSDVSHEHVMHIASRALAQGVDFRLLGPRNTMIQSTKPVVAVCAVRTGSGKSQTSRCVVKILKEVGYERVVAIRHPMPYGNLAKQAVQRFAAYDDLDQQECTIEEREEYEPYIDMGAVVFAGVDYQAILDKAEAEADAIVWDGGNNDLPFYKPDLHIVVTDPHRAGHELHYHPGETNLRMADVVVINKVDTAGYEAIVELLENIHDVNGDAVIIRSASPISVEDPSKIRGKKVVVIEDGPTLTHGEMEFGAGYIAAKYFGAAEIIDPRPFAVGSIVGTYAKYPNAKHVLPAMGYGENQISELEQTINQIPADLAIIATPIDLGRLVSINKPSVRVQYSLQEIGSPTLKEVIAEKLTAA